MKKLGLLVMPLMAISFLVSCNIGPSANGNTIINVHCDTSGCEFEFAYQSTKDIKVRWGDGTANGISKHIYAKPGDYKITVSNITSLSFFNPEERRALQGSECVNNISLSKTITSIEHHAFKDCFSLASITIPSSITSISVSAFEGCSSLTSIVVANDNPKFKSFDSNGIFELNDDGTTYTLIATCKETDIPDDKNINKIGDYAFDGCSGLQSITIPSSVTSIGNHAFDDCSTLSSITIPSSVISIGHYAFSGCSSINSITIPCSLYSSIGSAIFAGCSSLESITIDDFGTLIYTTLSSNGIFEYDDILGYTLISGCKETIIPAASNVTSIGYGAFQNCSPLSSIVIPSSVTFIDDYAFNGCSQLTTVDLTSFSFIPDLGEKVFLNCSEDLKLYVDPDMVSYFKSEWYGYANRIVPGPVPSSYN